jgi:MoaA/NifB/PqqE/SkfB family radical SAM enzyme
MKESVSAGAPIGAPEILTGPKAWLARLRFRAGLLRYLIKRKKYPLFILNPAKGGALRTARLLKEAKFGKVIRQNGTLRFSLSTPRWPSSAFDRMVANGGLNISKAGTSLRRHIDQAILAVTRRCAYTCEHCYERLNLGQEDVVPLSRWREVLREIQEIGTGIITFSGGEPFLRYDDLISLVEAGDKKASEFHVHTSGHGVTRERAQEMRRAGLEAAAVGLDDASPDRHDKLRGYPGAFREAREALSAFSEAGLFTYLNTCLSKDLIRSDGLPKLLELARDLGVGAVRILEPRPCGGYFGQDPESLFSEQDRQQTEDFYEKANKGGRYADIPFIFYEMYLEAPQRLGCRLGGLSLFYIDSLGNVLPCVFVPVSFGNIMQEDFGTIWKRMREAAPQPLRAGCAAFKMAETIQVKQALGLPMPIPYAEIKKEWESCLWTASWPRSAS